MVGIRTGAQYIEALKSRKPEIWLNGKIVENVLDEPYFKQPAQEIAKLYDMQHDPEYQDDLTVMCEETGERMATSFLMPRNYDDIMKRSKAFEVVARQTFGLMGRTPDFLNTVVTSLAQNS